MNFNAPHRRFNPLINEWVLVSPHRARRPWLGQMEKLPPEDRLTYDPTCYLCPGNARAGGVKNPPYTATFTFDNDFSAILPPEGDVAPDVDDGSPLFRAQPETGICRVVCFSPRHDLTLPELSLQEVEAVVCTWAEQTSDLGSRDYVRYVQVFENKGAMMGCSNPHPHSQIWSQHYIPNEPAKELVSFNDYAEKQHSCLLCDYLKEEQREKSRLVAANEHFTALVPFWAVWPFEILLLSNRHVGSLPELTGDEFTALADLLRQVTCRYDNLFETSFPYSMGFHQSPTDGGSYSSWHLHAHFYPPLLRSATVRKFMVGYELLAMPQRDLTAETAAERLRSLSETHYLVR